MRLSDGQCPQSRFDTPFPSLFCVTVNAALNRCSSHLPYLGVAWDEVVRPGSKYVLLHGIDNLLIVAEEDSWPWARVQPEDVTVFLFVGMQHLHRLAPQDIHVANQWEANK